MQQGQWTNEVERKLKELGFGFDCIGFGASDQPWNSWYRQGLSPEDAVAEACADQCVSAETGEYSAREHALRDAAEGA